MRMLMRLQLVGGWNNSAEHIPGVQDTFADKTCGWPTDIPTHKVRDLTSGGEWYEQPICQRSWGIFDVVLQTRNIISNDDIFDGTSRCTSSSTHGMLTVRARASQEQGTTWEKRKR